MFVSSWSLGSVPSKDTFFLPAGTPLWGPSPDPAGSGLGRVCAAVDQGEKEFSPQTYSHTFAFCMFVCVCVSVVLGVWVVTYAFPGNTFVSWIPS